MLRFCVCLVVTGILMLANCAQATTYYPSVGQGHFVTNDHCSSPGLVKWYYSVVDGCWRPKVGSGYYIGRNPYECDWYVRHHRRGYIRKE